MYDGHRKVSNLPETPKKKQETHNEMSIKILSPSRENQQDKMSVRSDKQISSTKHQSKRDRNAEKIAGRQHQTFLIERLFGHNKQPIVLKTQQAREAVMNFGLIDNHLQRLRLSFDALDKDKSDSIDRQEFMNDIGERSSAYTDKLFRLIDSDDHGSFDFEQYVRVVSSYCMFSKTQILHFCFECFDPMNSGYIDEEGFVSLCKYVNNSPLGFPQNFRAALKEFDENLDGYIDFKGESMYTVAIASSNAIILLNLVLIHIFDIRSLFIRAPMCLRDHNPFNPFRFVQQLSRATGRVHRIRKTLPCGDVPCVPFARCNAAHVPGEQGMVRHHGEAGTQKGR